MLLLACCVILVHSYLVDSVIVCPTFFDYYTYKTNKNCFDNPDGDSDYPGDIISRWGFYVRVYPIQTDDGYIINVERLSRTISKKSPLILGPGVTMNSMSYVDRGNKSLAFFLADEGYDMWLINWRGTRFSRGHVSLTPKDRKYWNMGFHDMAIHDLKTVSNLVYAETGKKGIYIGFSMGSTIGFIYNIKKQKSAEKTLKSIIHLAPIAKFEYSTSLLKYLSPFWPLVRPLVSLVWNGEIFPYRKDGTAICRPFPFQMKFCESIVKPFFGRNLRHTDPLTYPVTNIQNRDSISIGTIDHYAQIIMSNKFEEFSYGAIGNIKKYHQLRPPIYKFNELTVPQIMFVGEQDILATKKDTRIIYDHLPKKSKCGYHTLRNFDHSDFMISKNVVEVYYYKLLNAIQEIDAGRCKNN